MIKKGPMTRKNMLEMIKIAKKHGLKRMKLDDLEIEFFEKTPKRVGVPKGIENLTKPDPMPTEDELLFWSSGSDIKEEREFAEQVITKQQSN